MRKNSPALRPMGSLKNLLRAGMLMLHGRYLKLRGNLQRRNLRPSVERALDALKGIDHEIGRDVRLSTQFDKHAGAARKGAARALKQTPWGWTARRGMAIEEHMATAAPVDDWLTLHTDEHSTKKSRLPGVLANVSARKKLHDISKAYAREGTVLALLGEPLSLPILHPFDLKASGNETASWVVEKIIAYTSAVKGEFVQRTKRKLTSHQRALMDAYLDAYEQGVAEQLAYHADPSAPAATSTIEQAPDGAGPRSSTSRVPDLLKWTAYQELMRLEQRASEAPADTESAARAGRRDGVALVAPHQRLLTISTAEASAGRR